MDKKPTNEVKVEGLRVKVASYRVGPAFVTEAELCSDPDVTARSVGETKEVSLHRALGSLSMRLQYFRHLCLTVGG